MSVERRPETVQAARNKTSSALEQHRKASLSPGPTQDFGIKGFSLRKRSTDSLTKSGKLDETIRPPWKPFQKSKEINKSQSIDLGQPSTVKRKSPPKIREVKPVV